MPKLIPDPTLTIRPRKSTAFGTKSLLANLLLCCLASLVTTCGEAPPEDGGLPAGGAGLGPNQGGGGRQALVSTAWRGFHLRKDTRNPGAALTSAPVLVHFYENQTFTLSASEKNADPNARVVKGAYEAGPRSLSLTVLEENLDTLGGKGARSEFRYTLRDDHLHLYNDKLEFTLAATGETSSSSSSSSSTGQTSSGRPQASLFDSWVCSARGEARPWRITIFADLSFQLRAYLQDGSNLTTTWGQLTTYKEKVEVKPDQIQEQATLQFVGSAGEDPYVVLTRATSEKNQARATLYSGGQRSRPTTTYLCTRL